jgi:hypothetical protein
LSWMTKPGLLAVLDQGDTNACTGFALANVINFLLRKNGRSADAPVSAFMLYSMARRYDEIPGTREDTGSSLRGAMKGWYRHGAAAEPLWKKYDMPPPDPNPMADWSSEAARRPLGAYYRVDTRSITDMHTAIGESVLYASALCHSGWDEGDGVRQTRRETWVIPQRKLKPSDGGHAFAIVGYNQDGFLVLNSWTTTWGSRGLAVLTYEDWLDNAMDCWIAQLGVVTEQHTAVSQAGALRVVSEGKRTKVALASDPVLRDRELDPYIIDMGNNGQLSDDGRFRTDLKDLQWLAGHLFETARKEWGVKNAPVDVALYAHGGLVGEGSAADTAARWIPALYEAKIFPVFFMWETDLLSTLKNRLADVLMGEPKPTGTARDVFLRFWNARLERLLSKPGGIIWGEMKENARCISATFGGGHAGGARLLFEAAKKGPSFSPDKVRLHLIGHSAGAILHCHLADALLGAGWPIASVTFMAPACTTELFLGTIGKALKLGSVGRYNQFHLADRVEQQDPTCRPILGYGRSLLYLVSESFEEHRRTPILGMERCFAEAVQPRRLPNIVVHTAPSPISESSSHGGFDDDKTTLRSVIRLIQEKPPVTLALVGKHGTGRRTRRMVGQRARKVAQTR